MASPLSSAVLCVVAVAVLAMTATFATAEPMLEKRVVLHHGGWDRLAQLVEAVPELGLDHHGLNETHAIGYVARTELWERLAEWDGGSLDMHEVEHDGRVQAELALRDGMGAEEDSNDNKAAKSVVDAETEDSGAAEGGGEGEDGHGTAADRSNASRAFGAPIQSGTWSQHHDYQGMTALLQATEQRCGTFMRLESLGKTIPSRYSSTPRELWYMRVHKGIGRQAEDGQTEPPAVFAKVPRIKYVGNMHGDEVVGREILLHFLDDLCTKYGTDPVLTKLVDETDLYILPSMNPDGYELHQRANGHGYDLNRNFPDQYEGPPRPGTMQQETQLLIDFIESQYWVISINFHGGAVVANYPWDGNAQHRTGQYAATPDDAVFKDLAHTYANYHLTMKSSREFPDGITNGAYWYVLYGGMQDYNYLHSGTFELTVELSNIKWPSASSLPRYYEENKVAMAEYLHTVFKNTIWGVVHDSTCRPLPDSYVTVEGFDHNNDRSKIKHVVRTDSTGWFYRVLPGGKDYTLHIARDDTGRMEKTFDNVRVELNEHKVLQFCLGTDCDSAQCTHLINSA